MRECVVSALVVLCAAAVITICVEVFAKAMVRKEQDTEDDE